MRSLLVLALMSNFAWAAGSADELIELLKTELRTEMKEGREKGDNRAYQMQEILMRLQRGGDDENSDVSMSQAISALAATSSSEKVSSLCEEIGRQLAKERDKRDAETVEEMQKVFPESLRKALDAKTAKEVDEPLVVVGKLVRNRSYNRGQNSKIQTLLNDGQQLWEFIRQWQDYLAQVDADDESTARQRLQNLLGSSRDFSSFIPRSELLSRLSALQKKLPKTEEARQPRTISAAEAAELVKKAMEPCNQLEDMAAAITALNAQTSNGQFPNQQVSNTLNGLRMLQRSFEDFQRGQSVRVSLSMYNEDADGKLASLRGQLLLRTLPRVLGMPDEKAPKKEDNAASYLQGRLAEAQAATDWALASRILEAASTLNVQLVSSSGDSSALRSFLAGINQEKAKQYSLAVASFQAALKTGSQVIPPETIGSHLEAIKAVNPAGFEAGMQLTLTPPPESDPRFPPGYPLPASVRNRYYPGAMPAPTAPPDALTVPAKPTPEPKTTPPAETPSK